MSSLFTHHRPRRTESTQGASANPYLPTGVSATPATLKKNRVDEAALAPPPPLHSQVPNVNDKDSTVDERLKNVVYGIMDHIGNVMKLRTQEIESRMKASQDLNGLEQLFRSSQDKEGKVDWTKQTDEPKKEILTRLLEWGLVNNSPECQWDAKEAQVFLENLRKTQTELNSTNEWEAMEIRELLENKAFWIQLFSKFLEIKSTVAQKTTRG